MVFGDAQGKNFARWQIVIYSKGQEVAAHPLPGLMMADTEVLEWTNRCLRVEVRLGRLELQELGLRALGQWTAARAREMWSEKVAHLNFNDTAASDTVELERLPDHLRGTFAQWKLGADLRKLMGRRRFYRHRAAISGLTGVDIAVPPAPSTTARVVPIKRALEARPVGRPIWADRIDFDLRQAGAFIVDSAA